MRGITIVPVCLLVHIGLFVGTCIWHASVFHGTKYTLLNVQMFLQGNGHHENLASHLPLLYEYPQKGSKVSNEKEWLESTTDYMSNMYYSQWSVYEREHFPNDIPTDIITNIFYCFMGIDNETGSVFYNDIQSDFNIKSFVDVKTKKPGSETDKTNSKDSFVITKTIPTTGCIELLMTMRGINLNLSISMSIGGWGSGDHFAEVVESPKKFNKFIKSAIEMMQENRLDGIDIDWEFVDTEFQAEQMVQLLKGLRFEMNKIEKAESLQPGSLKLSIASPCTIEHLEILKLAEMDEHLSFWNVMCYDFAGSWSEKVEYHSNLYSTHEGQLSADSAIQHYISHGIHPRKLVLGMPNYGRGFTQTEGYGEQFNGTGEGTSDEAGIYNYNYLPLKGSIEMFDKDAVSAYSYDAKSKLWISYDNELSSVIKAGYVKKMNLGGGMWWESCGENYENLNRSTVYNFVLEINRLSHGVDT